jgi:hypothetical protein
MEPEKVVGGRRDDEASLMSTAVHLGRRNKLCLTAIN